MTSKKKQNIWCKSKKNIFKYNTTTIKQMIGGIKMAKMTGLGKGLDALFGPAPEEEQIKENDSLKNLKITEVIETNQEKDLIKKR